MSQSFRVTNRTIATAVAFVGLMACDGLTSPDSGDSSPVSFSVATSEVLGAAANRASFSDVADGPLVIISGKDTLRIDSVRVVLAQVSLSRLGDTTCGRPESNDAARESCRSLNSGPFIVKLPLTAGAFSLFDIPIPKGAYTAFSVRVHKPNRADSGPNVKAFLDSNPSWENKSIIVDGTFNGVAVHWSHDPVVQLMHVFNPPLVVDAKGANFTLKVDIASWFKTTNGALINPNAKTDALYPQIALNIKNSFKVFKDDKKKGRDDGQP